MECIFSCAHFTASKFRLRSADRNYKKKEEKKFFFVLLAKKKCTEKEK